MDCTLVSMPHTSMNAKPIAVTPCISNTVSEDKMQHKYQHRASTLLYRICDYETEILKRLT